MTDKPKPIEGEVFGPGETVEPKRETRSYTFGGRQAGKSFFRRNPKSFIVDEAVHISPAMIKRMQPLLKRAMDKARLDLEAQIMGRPKPRDVTPKPAPKNRRLK